MGDQKQSLVNIGFSDFEVLLKRSKNRVEKPRVIKRKKNPSENKKLN